MAVDMPNKIGRGNEKQKTDWQHAVAFVLLFTASAWFRFSRLQTQGIYLWDEAYFAVHARMFAGFFRAAWIGGDVLVRQIVQTGGIWHITAAKPLHYAFLTLAALIGNGSDSSFLAVSAFFGSASVLLLYLWGKQWNEMAGLCSAALLGGLGGHVWYSRSLLSSATASFFLCFGVFLYLRDMRLKPVYLFRSGLLLGMAVSAHYNTIPAVGIVLLYAFSRRDRRRFLWLALGAASILLAWQAAFSIRNFYSPHPLFDYFGELRHYLFEVSRRNPNQSWEPALLPRWIVMSSGWPTAALLCVGAAALLFSLRLKASDLPPEILIVALGPGMLVFWSVASLWWAQVARPIANLLPFICLSAGLGWANLAKRPMLQGTLRQALQLALPFFLFAAGAPFAGLYRLSVSPYKAAAAYLKDKPGVALTWNESVMSFYLQEPDRLYSLESGIPKIRPKNAKYLTGDYRASDQASWPDWLKAWCIKNPLMTLPYSKSDPRLLCMEETEDPQACADEKLPFAQGFALFIRPS